jgi:hypothetical protein
MNDQIFADRPDPAHQLQRDIYIQILHALRTMLPPPIDDSAEAVDRRERVAIAQIAALIPANADEADIAAHAVAASAQAADCLRLVTVHAADLHLAGQIRAQAASMGREARGYRTTLLRMQETRRKREANNETCDSAAWTEHCALGLMAMAREVAPAKASSIAATEPEPPPASPVAAEEQPSLVHEAERYAAVYPRRAKLIRKHRGMPLDCDFPPLEPDLLHAIVTGDGPNLRWADEYNPVVA